MLDSVLRHLFHGGVHGVAHESARKELSVASPLGGGAGLPVYVLVGDADPINAKLARLTPLIDVYRAAGLDVTLKVYPGGRHEMLNETNREEVVTDLLAWLDATVARLKRS